MSVAAALPIVVTAGVAAWLAGLGIFAVGVRSRLAASMSPIERAFASGLLGFAALAWWSVVLAETGWFGAATLVAAPVALATLTASGWIAAIRTRDRRGKRLRRATAAQAGVVLLLAAIGTTAYYPPFDVRLEARDPGVYYLSGVHIARSGSVAIEDPVIRALPPDERAYWFPADATGRSTRFIGFYLPDVERGVVLPQALPVHPSLIAIGYLGAGHTGASAVTPALAVLGVIAVFFFGLRWLGPLPGAAGAVVLAISFAQAWFARFVAAELSAQLLVMGGLYGLVMFRRHGDRAFGWIAASGLGLALLTKVELYGLALPLAILLLWDVTTGRLRTRQVLHFWLPLGAVAVHSVVHGALFLRPYFEDLAAQLNIELGTALRFVAASGALYLLTLLAAGWLRGMAVSRARVPRSVATGASRVVRLTVAAAVTLAAAWAYWIRPAAFYTPGIPPDQIRGWNAMNLVEMGWAVSPEVLLMAVLGVAILLTRRHRRRAAVLLLVLLPVVIGVWNRQIIPQVPWAYRRWLPIVLPTVALLGAFGLSWLLSRGVGRALATGSTVRRRLVGAVPLGVAVLTLLLVVTHQLTWLRAYDSHRELPGTARALDTLASTIEPGALLIFEPRTRLGLDRFIAALALDRDVDVLQLKRPKMDPEALRAVVLRRARGGHSTYLITTGYLDGPWPMGGVRESPIDIETLRLMPLTSASMARQGMELAPPLLVEELNIEAQIYRLEAGMQLPTLVAELDLGAPYDLPYLQGSRFHDVERGPVRDFRWTTGPASMALPGLGEFAREMIVKADPGTYRSLGPRFMRVLLDGLELGTVELRLGWREYRFPIPDEWEPPPDGPPMLTVEVPTFRPQTDLQGLADSRRLGIKLDKVGWQPVSPAGGR